MDLQPQKRESPQAHAPKPMGGRAISPDVAVAAAVMLGMLVVVTASWMGGLKAAVVVVVVVAAAATKGVEDAAAVVVTTVVAAVVAFSKNARRVLVPSWQDRDEVGSNHNINVHPPRISTCCTWTDRAVFLVVVMLICMCMKELLEGKKKPLKDRMERKIDRETRRREQYLCALVGWIPYYGQRSKMREKVSESHKHTVAVEIFREEQDGVIHLTEPDRKYEGHAAQLLCEHKSIVKTYSYIFIYTPICVYI